MLTKAALVSALLCFIIQVAHPVSGSSLLVQILVKSSSFSSNSTSGSSSSGPDECDNALPVVQVTLAAPVAGGLVAKWVPVGEPCMDIAQYEITLSEVGGTFENKRTIQETSSIFVALTVSTAYQVKVQPLDGSGQAVGTEVTAEQTTLDEPTSSYCPFPEFEVYFDANFAYCVSVVEQPAPDNNLLADAVCQSLHPEDIALVYHSANAEGMRTIQDFMEYLRTLTYTEEILVNGNWRDGEWGWGTLQSPNPVAQVDPALLTGVPAGGDGPDDYKMLYLDPAKDFGLSAAKEGQALGAIACMYIITL